MNPIWTNAGALAVAVLFYIWRAYAQVQERRNKTLRERVAYLLWCVADRVETRSCTVSCT
jgi:hypothetical protein